MERLNVSELDFCAHDVEEIAMFQDKLKDVPKEEQEYIWQCWDDYIDASFV